MLSHFLLCKYLKHNAAFTATAVGSGVRTAVRAGGCMTKLEVD